MANGYSNPYTATPGSEVADQLQDILTRKRLEARQSMMDQLQARNTQSEIDYRNQMAQSAAEDRAAQADERRQIGALRQEQANRQWLQDQGDMPGAIDQATYEKGHAIAPQLFQSTPNVGPSSDGQDLGSTYQYAGSPAYQKQISAFRGIQDLYNDPEFMKLTPEQRMAKIATVPGVAGMTGANSIGALMEKVLTSKYDNGGQGYVYDDLTKKLSHLDGTPVPPEEAKNVRRDQIQFLNRASSVVPPDRGTYMGPAIDPKSKQEIPGKFFILKNGKVEVQDAGSQYGIGAKPVDHPNAGVPKMDTLTRTAWIATAPKMFRSPKDQGAFSAGQRAGAAYIDKSTGDDHISSALRTALADPRAWGLTGAQLASKASGLSPEEVPEFSRIWDEMRNPQAPAQ